MPLGSSSEAPVMRPGPRTPKRGGFDVPTTGSGCSGSSGTPGICVEATQALPVRDAETRRAGRGASGRIATFAKTAGAFLVGMWRPPLLLIDLHRLSQQNPV